MSDVGIVGVGLTRFTKQKDAGVKPLVELAVKRALADSGLSLADMGAVFSGSAYTSRHGNGQTALRDMPTNGIPIVNVENACASGSCGLFEAYAWIKAGLCEAALAIGMDLTSWADGKLPMPDGRWYSELGLLTPNWYGLQASRYLAKYGVEPAALGRAVVKSRELARANPYAHFRTPVTLDQVMASPMISTPFTLHQCCPKTDGAGAVIVASRRFIEKKGLDAVWIKSAALGSGQPVFCDDANEQSTAARVAAQALNAAGAAAGDVDVVEVHDAFSIGEFLYAEAFGLCDAGGYPEYLAAGKSMPNGGGVAVNPSGGLLSRGHPIGATGMAQTAEIVWQLRGQAEGRQVDDARLGATLTMGAIEWEREANVAACFVLAKG